MLKNLWHFLEEVDDAAGDFLRGGWYCPTASMYGRYIPCKGDSCYFCQKIHSNPELRYYLLSALV